MKELEIDFEKDIRLEKIIVRKDEKNLWKIFKAHHYMNASLPSGCTFFTFYLVLPEGEFLIACLGMLLQINNLPAKRVTRFVILPEYQGLGFSKRILDGISQYYHRHNFLTYIVTFHPRLGQMLTTSKNWIPTTNNQKKTKSSNVIINGQLCIRSGVKMYRYKYNPQVQPNLEINIDFMSHNISEEEIRKQAFNDNITEYTTNERNKYIRQIREQKEKDKKEAELDKQMAPVFVKKKKHDKRSKETLKRIKEMKERNGKSATR